MQWNTKERDARTFSRKQSYALTASQNFCIASGWKTRFGIRCTSEYRSRLFRKNTETKSRRSFNANVAANPALALRLQAWPVVGRVVELESLRLHPYENVSENSQHCSGRQFSVLLDCFR